MREKSLSNLRAIIISMLHIGVGISIVAISSFLNAELKFADWETSQISIYLGIPVLFELSRLFFAYIYDNLGYMRSSLSTGIIASGIGLLLLPFSITPIGNYTIILAVSLFYFGSSIMTTLVDANLTQLSTKDEKSKIAAVIQTMRLVGFALGGILGSLFYSLLTFNEFVIAVFLVYIILGVISLIFVIPQPPVTLERKKFGTSVVESISLLSKGLARLMTIFLFLYPIGLFMQDLILEPFAIDQFNFDKENVGRIVAIWTSLTLIFVPVGAFLADKFSRIWPIVGGELLSIVGLLTFALTTHFNSLPVFYFGLIIFGIGNGIASAPAIGMMLEVSSRFPEYLTLLLGFFGLMTTVGRALAAVLGGIILLITNQSYTVLFSIEAIIVLLGLLPLISLDRQLDDEEIHPELLDPIEVSSINLN